eukprot:scaffold276506_cov32-Tisochrysis_lutea.AAC.4
MLARTSRTEKEAIEAPVESRECHARRHCAIASSWIPNGGKCQALIITAKQAVVRSICRGGRRNPPYSTDRMNLAKSKAPILAMKSYAAPNRGGAVGADKRAHLMVMRHPIAFTAMLQAVRDHIHWRTPFLLERRAPRLACTSRSLLAAGEEELRSAKDVCHLSICVHSREGTVCDYHLLLALRLVDSGLILSSESGETRIERARARFRILRETRGVVRYLRMPVGSG